MDLKHLRYFVAVAEELHFTRAAERLGIQQPPLSLQIRKLEAELETPLFHRLTRGVELTEAGELLLEEARRLLDQAGRTKAIVRSRARGESGRLRVGFSGGTALQPRVARLFRAYRERYPHVLLSPEQSNTPQLIARLRDRSVDMAFVRPPFAEGHGITLQPFVAEPMLIVLPSHHRQAGSRSVALTALAEETLILFPRSVGPGFYDSIIASCQRAGFTPTLGQEAPQLESIVSLVAAGFGVSIVPQSIEQIRTDGVAYVAIRGEAPRAPIGLAFRKDERSATVRNFVALARHQARN